MPIPLRRLIWAWLLCFVTAIAMGAIAIIYADRAAESARQDANRSVRETQQVMCLAFDLIHEGQLREPPTTEAGKSFAKVVDDIRNKFKCEEK